MARNSNWCQMVEPFAEEQTSSLKSLAKALRKQTFHGLDYTAFLEAFENWSDDCCVNKPALMFVMTEIAGSPSDKPVRERALDLYDEYMRKIGKIM